MKRFAVAFLLILLATPALAESFSARVVGITDGDTITVLTTDKTRVKIRLHGIDAPETGQDFGSRAKQAASEMAFDKDVTVKVVDHDRYGRTVAVVKLPDGRLLNREMVERGMAWYYRKYAPGDVILNRAEICARKVHLGLWSQPNPVPPWDWRQGRGVPVTAGVVGNRRSRLYHAPHCRGVAAMKEGNRVAFGSAGEAEEAGYRRAGDCSNRSTKLKSSLDRVESSQGKETADMAIEDK